MIQILWELKLRQFLGPPLRKKNTKISSFCKFCKNHVSSLGLERGPKFKLHHHNSKPSMNCLSPLEKGKPYTSNWVPRREWNLLATQNGYLNLPPRGFLLKLQDKAFLANSFFSLEQWFSKCGPPIKLASFGISLEIQVLRSYSRYIESETLKMGPSCLGFKGKDPQLILMCSSLSFTDLQDHKFFLHSCRIISEEMRRNYII